jgi:thiol-disulfide isomerase/thioredoxin
MKKLLLTLCLLAGFGVTQAQLNDVPVPGGIVLTDIDGNVWDVDALLDDGYVVVLDVFATWCPPCLALAESGVLDDIWHDFGPDGADKVIVLSIEADPSTPTSDIYGPSGSSLADWSSIIGNPLIDDPSMVSTLAIGFWPTMYVVCPTDRKIYNLAFAEYSTYNALRNSSLNLSCATADDAVDAGVTQFSGATEICEAGDMTISVMNLGSDPLTAFDVEVFAEGNVQSSTPWTGNISTFNSTEVTVPAPWLAGDNDVEFRVIASGDAKASNDVRVVPMGLAPQNPGLTFELVLQTDDYGYETYWEFRDAMGAVIASGGNTNVGPNGGGAQTAGSGDPGAYGNNALITETITVPSEGCYEFVIVDDYGDGICCGWGEGSYVIRDADGNTMTSGGVFGPMRTNNLRSGQASGLNALNGIGSMNLYPNPASNAVFLQVEGMEVLNAGIVITNALGQVVEMRAEQQFILGTNAFTFDVSELPAGLYNATITNNNGQRTVSFSVAR